jgi:hypothetical protein
VNDLDQEARSNSGSFSIATNASGVMILVETPDMLMI